MWSNILPNFEYSTSMSYFQLVVPTRDTVCYSWFLEQNIQLLVPIYITGATGTGKSIIVNKLLDKMQSENTISSLSITFSAKTSAIAT